ncbi:hypothetical protein ACFC1R_35070 [Kitasatospora sp. NPDC056138]|uniref:hypothetical protein n=1 Tax=Kitasatospora sp. NPDC056138 TaxID=3345724 RepID=UPI0035DC2C9F
MSNQGAPPQHRPDDGWWHAVYAGPAGTLPDAPGTGVDEGSVDDWFDTAAGMISAQRAADPRVGTRAAVGPTVDDLAADDLPVADALVADPQIEDPPAGTRGSGLPTAERADRPEPAGSTATVEDLAGNGPPRPAEVSIDDWFDSAVGVIGAQRSVDQPATPGPPRAVRQSPEGAEAVPETEATPEGGVGGTAGGEADAEPVGAAAEPAPGPPSLVKSVGGTDDGARTVPETRDEPEASEGQLPQPEPHSAAEPRSATEPVTAPEPVPPTPPAPPVAPVDTPGDAPASASAAVPAAESSGTPASALASAPVSTSVSAPADGDEAAPRPSVPRQVHQHQHQHQQPHPVPHIGERPPTYGPEPTTLPAADPDELSALAPDTAIDGAQYGSATLRAVSVRGDSARFRGEPRRDSLLVTRFGEGEDGLLLAVLATPGRAQPSAAAAEACRQLAAAIGRSRAELAADLRAGARDRLRYGLQRLTARAAAPLRVDGPSAPAVVPGPTDPAAGSGAGSLHCLLLPLHPEASHRAAFGTGPGALYLLRSGHWIDAYGARLLHHPDGRPPVPPPSVAPPRPFRFRLVPATPGDILLLCSPGLAEPIAEEPAVAHFLSSHWAHPHPPGSVDFLRQVQVRAKGHDDDRTAAALWTE